MTWILRDRMGCTEREAPRARMLEVLAEAMSSDDEEHADVSVQHESGWTISFRPSGLLIYEDVDSDDPPRQLTGCTSEQVMDLWTLLAIGDFRSLEAQPWEPAKV